MVKLKPKEPQVWTRNKILFTAFAARVCLILYSNVHDYMFQVSFTDIDYSVFSDAAQHVANGGSPYERATYRYTPALAWFLTPNTVWRDFGLSFTYHIDCKYVFCIADIVVAWLCFEIADLFRGTRDPSSSESISMPVVVFWLANPLTAVVSARGSSDSLVCVAVLLTLYLIIKQKCLPAALTHGFIAVHLKIYPIIYLPSIYLYYICQENQATLKETVKKSWSQNGIFGVIRSLVSPKGFGFALVSILSFAFSVAFFYLIYGDVFLEEFLLYHVKRRDIRHNFSPYFYILYLTDRNPFLSKVVGYIAFVPQLVSIVTFALRFHNDLAFCWFATTFAFVAFNKVSTSQYFIWFIVFLPLITEQVNMSKQRVAVISATWFVGQGIWLLFAYLFEFQGLDTFLYIWLASLLFLFINCVILRDVILHYEPLQVVPVSNINITKKVD